MTDRVRSSGRLLGLAALVWFGVGPASAHEFGSSAGTVVPITVVLALSVGVATLGGLWALVGSTRLTTLAPPTRRRLTTLFGVVLVGLGVSVFLPIAVTDPVVAVAGVLLGSVVGLVLPHHHATGERFVNRATAVSGALTLHRVFEGIALAAVYAANEALGVVTVLLLTLHTTVETVAVGVEYGSTGRRSRGLAAILLLQAGFVFSAAVTLLAAGSLPAVVRGFVLAGVAGLLVVVGAHDVRGHVVEGPRQRLGSEVE
ncbi:hypothetical protein ACFQJC_16535 [Haloferax namakaokahaiae]|uniref:Uncharacterized protein n=1 Tax=Haloferax namakaokahaiae TaxID=1748331 RepID=A0ABD5ZIN4_9EURY